MNTMMLTMIFIDIKLHFYTMSSSTVAAVFVINLLQGAKERGYNLKQLLLDNDISPHVLEQPKARITFLQLTQIGQAVIRLMDDEYCGLLDKPQRQNSYKMACYAAIHAEDIGEAITLMMEFSNLFENSLQYSVVREKQLTICRLTRRPYSRIKNTYAIESILLTLHRTLCWFANARLPLLRVDLDYPAPAYQHEYRYLFYGSPVSFGQQYSALIFNDSDLRLKNVRDFGELKHFVNQSPITLLSQTVDPAQLSPQLRAWLGRQISEHQIAPSIEEAAEQFQLTPQTLRRHLKKEGASYKLLKMEVRRDMAIKLVTDKEHSIETIAIRLGFSEAPAFIRAFNGWTGLTPLAYQKLNL